MKRRRRREILTLEQERARQRRAARVAAKGTVVTAILLTLASIPVHAQFLEFKNPKSPRTKDGKVNLAAPVQKQADAHPVRPVLPGRDGRREVMSVADSHACILRYSVRQF